MNPITRKSLIISSIFSKGKKGYQKTLLYFNFELIVPFVYWICKFVLIVSVICTKLLGISSIHYN